MSRSPLHSDRLPPSLARVVSEPGTACVVISRPGTDRLPHILASILQGFRKQNPDTPVFVVAHSKPGAQALEQGVLGLKFHADGKDARVEYLWPDLRYVVERCRTNPSCPLIVIDETRVRHMRVDTAIGLARRLVSDVSARAIILTTPDRGGELPKWWPGLEVVPNIHDPRDFEPEHLLPRRTLTPANRMRVSEWACADFLDAGYSPFDGAPITCTDPKDIARVMEALQMIGICDRVGFSLTNLGTWACQWELDPRIATIVAKASKLQDPFNLFPAISLLEELPVKGEAAPWYDSLLPYSGKGLKSDLAAAGEALSSFDRTGRGRASQRALSYLERRVGNIKGMCRSLEIPFPGFMSRDPVNRQELAIAVTAGLIDHLALAAGTQDRRFLPVFFPEHGYRSVFSASQCRDAFLIVGAPKDTTGAASGESQPRFVLPTETTPAVIDKAFPGSVQERERWRSAPHLGDEVRTIALSVGGRAAKIFALKASEGAAFAPDLITESRAALYLSGMTFSLDRSSPRDVEARAFEEGFTAEALATIRCADGDILANGRIVRFAFSNGTQIEACTWPELADEVRGIR